MDHCNTVALCPTLVRGFGNVVITPSVRELALLVDADVRSMVQSLSSVTLLVMGESDMVNDRASAARATSLRGHAASCAHGPAELHRGDSV
jgi:hypothetical protein